MILLLIYMWSRFRTIRTRFRFVAGLLDHRLYSILALRFVLKIQSNKSLNLESFWYLILFSFMDRTLGELVIHRNPTKHTRKVQV
jgi:hypothetical protein